MAESTELAVGYISLAVSTKGLGSQVAREFTGVEKQAEKSGKSAGSRLSKGFGSAVKAGALGAAVAGAVAVKGIGSAIKAAGDLEQSVGGVKAVFKDYAGSIDASSRAAAKSVGLSQDAYNGLANTLGSTLKNKGVKDFGKQTQVLIGLGADLASQFGGSSKEAVEALSSALRGETDPIERYGVSMNQAAIEAEALAMGLAKPIKNSRDIAIAQQRATVAQDRYNKAVKEHGKDSVEATSAQASLGSAQRTLEKAVSGVTPKLNDQQKAMAALSLINKQTADAQGNFARESDTLQGKQARAAAQWENLSAKIGGVFLPVASKVMGVISERILPAMDRMSPALTSVGQGFGVVGKTVGIFAGGLKAASPTIEAIKDFIGGLLPVLRGMGSQILGVVVPAFKSIGGLITTQLLPSFRAMLPVLLPVAKFMVRLFGGIILEVIRGATQAIKGIINVISGVFKLVVALVNGDWKAAWGAVKQVVMGAINAVIGALRVWMNLGILGLFKRGALSLLKGWRGLWTGVQGLALRGMAAVRSLVGSALSAIGRLFVAGAKGYVGLWLRLFKTLVSLGRNGWTAIRSVFSSALGWVTSTFRTGWARLQGIITRPISLAKSAVQSLLGAGKGGLQSVFSTAVGAVGRIWGRLQSLAKAPVRFIVETVINQGLLGAFRKISDVVGYDAGKKLSVGLPPGFHDGGYTGNLPERRVAGVVHGDEHVIKAKSRRRIERMAPGYLDYLNEHGKLPGYAQGGRVSWKGHQFSSLFAGRLQQAEKMSGTTFNIFQGGFRPTTSYSGTSHRGDAVDLGPIRTSVVKALRQVGIAAWDRTGKGNWVPHIHGVPTPGAGYAAGSAVWQAQDYLRGGDGLGGRDNGPRVRAVSGLGGAGGFVDDLFDAAGALKKKFTGPLDKLKSLGDSPFVKMASRIPHMVKDALLDKAKGFVGSVAGKVADKIGDVVSGGTNRARGLALLTKAGFNPATQWSPLNKLWTKESNWRTTATNPSSGAYGIPQALPGSKMGSVAGDWRTNPNTQIRWGLGYIRDRYGSPAKAWAHSQRVNWYDQGGVLDHNTVGINTSRKPEAVLTNPQWKMLDRVANRAVATNGAHLGSGRQVVINGGVHGYSAAEVGAAIATKIRRDEALAPVWD